MKQNETKILIADDDPQFRQYLVDLLVGQGYKVDSVPDGQKCLEYCKKGLPDLLVTDIIMPEKEGMELIGYFRKNHPQVPVIAVSGGGRTSADCYLPMAKTLGARFTFEKPLNKERFLFAVEHSLEKND